MYDLRIEREKIAAQNGRNFENSKVVSGRAYLKAIFVSGSLAINNTAYESDFDVLSVAQIGTPLYLQNIFIFGGLSFRRSQDKI